MKFHVSDRATIYKNLRLDSGMTALETAAILGITPETMSRRENGKTTVTNEALIAMRHVTEEALQIIWSFTAKERDADEGEEPTRTPQTSPDKERGWTPFGPSKDPGRNDPCKCGSRAKFKKCCGR